MGKKKLTDAEARERASKAAPAFVPTSTYPGSVGTQWEGLCLQCGNPWSPRLSNLLRYDDDRSIMCFKCTKENQRKRPALCVIPDCQTLEEFPRKGMCQKHYIRWKVHGDPNYVYATEGCSVEGCDKPYYGNGFCQMHNARVRRWGETGGAEPMWHPQVGECEIADCEGDKHSRGLCSRHYQRLLKNGDPLLVKPRGTNRKYPPICSMPECGGKHHAKGYCGKHLRRFNKHGDAEVVAFNRKYAPGQACQMSDCGSPVLSRGYCIKHYARWRAHGDPNFVTPRIEICEITGCGSPHYGRGWCQTHWHRWRTQGDPLWEPPPRVEEDEALEIAFSVGFIPDTPYPGSTDAPWHGACMECGTEASPRIRTILGGAQPMCRCVRLRVGATRTAASRERCRTDLEAEEYTLRSFEMRPRASDGQNLSWVLFTCPAGHVGEMSVNNWNSGKRCSTCRPGGYNSDMPGCFYVVVDDSIVKCGIANKTALGARLLTHQRQGLAQVVAVLDFERGFDAVAIESMWRAHVRSLRIAGVWQVSAERLPDGFTEALPITPDVMEFIAELLSIEITDEELIESLTSATA